MIRDDTGWILRPWGRFWIFVVLLSTAYSPVLLRLLRYSVASELDSYIPLIPFISGYLVYLKRGTVAVTVAPPPQKIIPIIAWVVSTGLLVAQGLLVSGSWFTGEASVLVLPVMSYITALMGGVVYVFGWPAFREKWFAWLFLYYMVPFPEPVAHLLMVALQQGSAEVAYAMFKLTGTPVFRDGLTFCLPDLTIQVAEECSGIHSSIVLFITSLVAGQLFLKKPVGRIMLVILVLPLCLIRNGFRIVSISLLTIYVDSGIIAGPLHHRGGPVYFILSLGVLAAAVWGIRWCERRRSA
ncbi:MAG: exosortase/archaeosortase family protein [bacterium]